jgi:glyoxylase-like metal-dependent hydrolase (beta-lactamase superfamily II)
MPRATRTGHGMTRTLVLSSIVIAGGLMVAGKALLAQQPPPQPDYAEIEKVKDGLYMVKNGGGNTAVFVTANGVVLVDTKLANWGQRIMDQVKTVTDKPVTHIINTHTHGDHVGSNDFFAPSVEIVAHANVKASMAQMKEFADPAKAHALPDRTYTDRMTVLGGDDAIDLFHFGAAHTNGDSYVVFRRLGVMHAGDTFPRKSTPFIDRNNGGNGVAYPETLAKAAATITNVDTVIPGHSAVTSWAAFVEYGEFMRAVVDEVKKAKAAGKTPEAAVAGITLPEKFKDYGRQSLKDNVAAIYADLP